MKTRKGLVSIVICLTVLIGFATTRVDHAYGGQGIPVYLGEFCWDTAMGGFLKIGVTHMGGGHVSFCGTAEYVSAGMVWAINGNFEVIGTDVEVTWTDAIRFTGGDTFSSRVGNAVLDIDTLNGPSRCMEMNWEDGVCTLTYGTDVLYFTTCEPASSPNGEDHREELIKLFKNFVPVQE